MRRLLVTGGAGFIGTNFVHYWLENHPQDRVVVLDAFTYAGNPENLAGLGDNPGLRVVEGDIDDRLLVEQLLTMESLDTVVHFAAESHVDRSIDGPEAFVHTNTVGTHSLLQAVRRVWGSGSRTSRPRFHHVSTDEVYGSLGPDDPAFTEESAFAPNSPYSASKAASDHLARAYFRTYDLPVTVSHCSNNYGPYQFPEKLLPLMITNLLRGESLPVYGDGGNIRDWLYVGDHCRAIDAILDRGQEGATYDIGGGEERTNVDLVYTLCRLIDRLFASEPSLRRRFPAAPPSRGRASESLVTFVQDRPGHDRRYAVNPGRIERELGFRPSVTLEEGLERTVRWYIDNQGWWEAVQDGSYRFALPLGREGGEPRAARAGGAD
ncbi:MAG: dTDP-glucose 4,6-dehydratase [Ectothiorhodospiraceae bacterium]